MAFMDYQKPNIEQANPMGAYINALNMKQSNDLNALRIQREQKALDKEAKSEELSTEYANTKDKAIFDKLVSIDPQKANSIMDSFNKMDDRQLLETQRRAQNMAKLTFDLASDKDDNSVLQKYANIYQGLKPEQQQGLPPPNQVDANTIRQLSAGFTNQATDFNTLITYKMNREMKAEDREFTKGENALNRANQKEVAQIGADKSLAVAKLQSDTSRYNTDTNAQLYKEGLKGFGGDNKANAIEVQAYRSAVATLNNVLASPQEKEQARNTINSLDSKYRVTNSTENNTTPQSNDPLGIRKR